MFPQWKGSYVASHLGRFVRLLWQYSLGNDTGNMRLADEDTKHSELALEDVEKA